MLNFIRRERIYIWMLFFVLAVNVMSAGRVEKAPQEEKKAISTMTFEEIGVTEEKVKDFFESDRFSARFFRYAVVLGFFVFIVSLILNLGFIFRKSRIRRIWDKSTRIIRGDSCLVSWGISDLIRAGIIIVFAGYIIGIIEGLIFKLFNINIGVNLRMIFNTFFLDIAVAWVVLYFVLVKYKERLQALGFRFSFFIRNILSGITAYIFILPLLLVILILSIWVLNLLGHTPPPQPVFEVFIEEKRSRVLLFLTIFVSVFGPFIEEMFFRGFMYSAIKKRLGVIGAAFLSAAIFSMLHTNVVGFLPIMALGVLLAYLYETTGTLVASITVHIMHNSIIVGFVFFVKELMG